MNVKEAIDTSNKLGRNYDARLSIFKDLSCQILEDTACKYSFDDIVLFLQEVWSLEVEAENAYRMVMTNSQSKLSHEINQNCYQIIKTHKIENIDIRGYFTRAMMYIEKNPKKWSELQREEDEIDGLKIARWERENKK